MFRFKLHHFTDPAFLLSIDPPRLRMFLKQFEKYLTLRDFVIPSDAKFTPSHVNELIGIFNTPTSRTPAEMVEALFHIDEMANEDGMEALLLVASKEGLELPEGQLSEADVAMHMWLYHPDLLRRANCERIVLRVQTFRYFFNKTFEVPKFVTPTDDVLNLICDQLNRFNRDRLRGGGCAVWMYEFGDDIAFLMRLPIPMKRDEVMDGEICRHDVRRPVQYDLAVYNVKTGELRVRANLVSERREYCRIFGEQLFGDPEFFPPSELFDLGAIHERGEDIQSPAHVEGIRQVRLVELQEVLLGQQTLKLTFKSEQVFDAIKEHNKRLTPTGRLSQAKFKFWFIAGGDVTVTIYAGNQVRFSRQDGIDAIEQWMIHHGIKINRHATLRIPTAAPLADALSNPESSRTSPAVATRIS